MSSQPLAEARILILEDEFLIALDVEELCRDNGASEVTIMRSLDELGAAARPLSFDAAVIDLRLGGASTVEFARSLFQSGVPFLFATGYADATEIAQEFPGVPVIGKPYIGDELVAALAQTMGRASAS